MKVDLGISAPARQAIVDGLSRYLADTYAMYLKTQGFHWNLQGPEFYALHLLFEKQYEEMAEELDVLAERIRALGYFVDARFSAFNQLTQVRDEDKILNSKEMLLSLIEGHGTLIRHGRKVAEIADEEKDFASVDLLGRSLAAHEKMVWMLSSHLI